MARRARRSSTSPLPKVREVELSDKYVKLRAAAAVIFLIIGAAAIAYGVSQIFAVEKGWQEIEASASATSCAGDFTLLYDIGAGDVSARVESRELKALWSRLTTDGEKIFDPRNEYDGVGNLASLNAHPNETVELEPALYAALELLERYGDRTAYLGPAFGRYDNVFSCTGDWQLPDYDPVSGQDMRELYGKVAAFASDPDSVSVELLGDNKARLKVSQTYLDFLENEGLEGTVDLYWMRNAFLADYMAGELRAAGYTKAVISSYDGFVRNIDTRETSFGLDVLDTQNGVLTGAAHMDYQGALTVAAYRAFPVIREDARRLYVTEKGEIRTPYLRLADGLPGTSTDSLTVYSRTMTCAELMLETAPLFTGDTLTPQDLAAMQNCHALWPDGDTVYATDPDAQLKAGEGYEIEMVK